MGAVGLFTYAGKFRRRGLNGYVQSVSVVCYNTLLYLQRYSSQRHGATRNPIPTPNRNIGGDQLKKWALLCGEFQSVLLNS